jgi:6-phosphogluconolactonase
MLRQRLLTCILSLTAVGALCHRSFVSAQCQRPHNRPGAVYTMTNGASKNSVLAFHRTADGRLMPAGMFSTGGKGTGSGLGNQGGVVLTPDNHWLLVVNAGSNQVSVFRVRRTGLMLTDLAGSGGKRPISVTVHHNLVYVLNAGGAASSTDRIAGFRLGHHGKLKAIPGSIQPLSANSTGPAQIGFSPKGHALVVTEKGTNKIDVYAVSRDGQAGPPTSYPSSGKTPFGFSFGHKNRLFVSEATGGGADASTVSSYQLKRNGTLIPISKALPTTETAACWLVVSKDGRFAYTTNTGSASVTGLAISRKGELSLLQANGVSGKTGAGPIDMGFTVGGRFLYTLNAGDDSISCFRVKRGNGALTPQLGLDKLPDGLNGLAVR